MNHFTGRLRRIVERSVEGTGERSRRVAVTKRTHGTLGKEEREMEKRKKKKRRKEQEGEKKRAIGDTRSEMSWRQSRQVALRR